MPGTTPREQGGGGERGLRARLPLGREFVRVMFFSFFLGVPASHFVCDFVLYVCSVCLHRILHECVCWWVRDCVPGHCSRPLVAFSYKNGKSVSLSCMQDPVCVGVGEAVSMTMRHPPRNPTRGHLLVCRRH